MQPIYTSLSPNLEQDDRDLAKSLLFKPFSWKEGPERARLRNKLKNYLGTKEVFLYESGRTALFAALKALKIGHGDEVILQAYTCVAVPEPVLWVGAKPVYADINLSSANISLESVNKLINVNTKAIIVQHTFGNPAPINQLVHIAKERGIYLIEDCAHAFGAEFENQKLGTFGDVSFSSFGRDKVISSVFGGFLAINNRSLVEPVKNTSMRFDYPKRLWIKKQLLHPIITWNTKNGGGFFAKAIFVLSKKFGLTSKAVEQCERSGKKPSFIGHRMPNALATLALNQFKKLERFNRHRQALASYYAKHLRKDIRFQKQGKDGIYLRFLIQTANPKGLMQEAKEQKIYLGDWYQQTIAPEGVQNESIQLNEQDTPNAARLARRSINLPTDINIGKAEAERIVTFINEHAA